MSAQFDLADLNRRMQGAIAALKHELVGLRTGRASAALLEPVMVLAYGQAMPINQVATISVTEARALAVSFSARRSRHSIPFRSGKRSMPPQLPSAHVGRRLSILAARQLSIPSPMCSIP